MAGSSPHSFNKTHLQDPNPTPISSSTPTKPPKGKSFFTHYFFSKSMIIIVVLLVFSLFPSQVPEIFKKTTIINKIWELIYLLVIGIAVCYGLFSTKMNNRVHSSDDSDGAKEAYLSEISHISSIFEDGVQSSYEFDERDSEFGIGLRKSDKKKLNQCFIGESVVVIDDKNYVLEQLSKRRTIKQNYGSKSLDSAAGKSVLQDSSTCRDGIKKGKFRGLVPIKLDEKFKETGSDSDPDSNSNSDSRTPLNWRSKSMRLEKIANETSHFRNPSVGVLDLRSQSVRVSTPSQMKNSSENKEASFMESKPRESTTDSFSEMNDFSDSKDILKETVKDSSDSILKPPPIANTYKRGKSVRTKRPKEQIIEAKSEIFQNQNYNDFETGSKLGTNATNVNHDDYLSDLEPHSGEVDRKAEEFIAKFREQIRLQQATSARKLNLSVLEDGYLS